MTAPDEPVPCQAPHCGRPLKSAESKARGMGPVCHARRYPRPAARHHIPAGPTGSARLAAPGQGPDLLDELDGTP